MMRKTLLPFLVFGLLVFTKGCYYLQQGAALVQIYGSGKPKELLLADPALDDKTRRFLKEAASVRTFALTELGLRENRNYTSFVRIERDYLAAVVSAARPLSFEQHFWFHPIVGAVPYQGYFNLEDARAEATRLRNEGWDVWIRPVDAFSTLGWFQDPLFSFMTDYDPGTLAELLIQEQTHATVWIENHVDFNESLGQVVSRAGTEEYLRATYGPESKELEVYLANQLTHTRFFGLFLGLKAELETLYGSELSDIKKLEHKRAIIAAFQGALPEELATWKDAPLNNAVLATIGNYESRVPEIETYLQACGGLRQMLVRLQFLDRRHPDPWAWIQEDGRLARKAASAR